MRTKIFGINLKNLAVALDRTVIVAFDLAQLAPLLRARTDLDADEVRYLEEVIGAAVRRFDIERAAREK